MKPLLSFVVFATLTAVIVHFTLRLVYYYYHLISKTANMPAAPGTTWPIIGNALLLVGIKDVKGMWTVLSKLANMTPRLMKTWLGPKLIIFVTDAKLIQGLVASSKCVYKDETVYNGFRMVTDGIFARNGNQWAVLRKPLEKLLHLKLMPNFYDIFQAKVIQLSNKWEKYCDTGEFNVNHDMALCTLDMVSETHLGVKGTQLDKMTFYLADTTAKALDCIYRKALKIHYHIDFIFKYSSLYKDFLDVADGFGKMGDEIISSRYKAYGQKNIFPDDPKFVHEYYPDVAIQNGLREGMSKETLRGSFADFAVAGSETSAIAISSTLLYLAMHPEYQEKAYQEQISTMGSSLSPPTLDELAEMNYLTMTIKETLRHVSIPGVVRKVTSDLEIENYTFPKGSSVYIFYNECRKQEQHWDRPNEYYPDHFLPEKIANRPKGAYMAFHSGPRSCPGKHYAMVSMKCIISTLLRNFKFSTKLKYNELVYVYKLMVEFDNGYPLEITKRTPLAM